MEGVEYDIIPALISSGLACSRLDVLIIEWHGNKRTTAPRKVIHTYTLYTLYTLYTIYTIYTHTHYIHTYTLYTLYTLFPLYT